MLDATTPNREDPNKDPAFVVIGIQTMPIDIDVYVATEELPFVVCFEENRAEQAP